jgi:hypothetical protein
MGRLRNGYESELFLGVAEEVVDLFGMDEVILYRLDRASACPEYNGVYGEISGDRKFIAYKTRAHYQEITDEFQVSERGETDIYNSTVFFALRHLIGAGIPRDDSREYMQEGDIVIFFWRGERIAFDIIDVKREGYINNSDTFVGYTCQVKRNSSFIPERNSLSEVIE